MVFTRHPTIENQSHGIPYRTSLEPLTADGHLAVGHGRHHRVSRKLICRYLPQLNGLSQRDSNRGAPKMVMIHGLSASTISALGMPHFETKTACAASTKYPMDHCRSIPLDTWRIIRCNISGCEPLLLSPTTIVIPMIYLVGIRLLTTIVGDIPIKSHELVG